MTQLSPGTPPEPADGEPPVFRFRSAPLAARADRLQGDVVIFLPVSWQIIGYLIFAATLAAGGFLAFGSYARVETVSGQIVPDKGVVAIVPSRGGVVTQVLAGEGEYVAEGAVLAAIRAEEFLPEGGSSASEIAGSIARQDESLAAQLRSARAAAAADRRENLALKSGLAAEITILESQVDLQRGLVRSAEEDITRLRPVAEKGFISEHQMRGRRDVLLTRQQQFAQLQQLLASRRAALAQAEAGGAQAAAQAQESAAGLAASRAQIEQQAVTTRGASGYLMRAPVAGRVTALTARAGGQASPQAALMSIVPAGAVLRAELAVPTSAIGFIRPGQEVRLAIDTFPYQRFGTVKGRVITVAGSAVEQPGAQNSTVRAYPVAIALDRQDIEAFGRREPLLAGMTLSARIVLEKRSFLQWLFEPIFAVSRR